MRTISIEAQTHGRVLVKDAGGSADPSLFIVGFHGYAQNAEDMYSELERIPGSDSWTIVSVQALHRFYLRGDEKIVASWMTRQDRESAIADNIDYINRAVREVLGARPQTPLVFAGFSQGVAMAYRAAVLGAHRALAVIAVGGDIPPEIKSAPVNRFPFIFIGAGDSDHWYTPGKLQADEEFLQAHGVRADVFRYSGGHEWTEELRHRIHQVVKQLT